MIFAGITGTAVANAAAIGGILIPAMKEVFVYCRLLYLQEAYRKGPDR
jgi:hypothetical protein